LAIASHGRGFYILDNIGPLRQYNASMAASADPVLFAPATLIRAGTPGTIQYWLKQPAKTVKLEILDARGQVIRTYQDTTAATGGRGGRGGATPDSAAAAGGEGRGRGNAGPQGPARTAGLNTFTW